MSKKIEEDYLISHEDLMDTDLSAVDLRVYLVTRLKVRSYEAVGKQFAPDGVEYAATLGIHPRMLQKAFEKLEKKGYILREYKNRKRIIHI